MFIHGLKRFRPAYLAVLFAPACSFAQLKINEVYYRPSLAPGANQFVELYNAGTNVAYLDGLILTEEASDGVEGVFRFPGGGTDHPVPPGGYVVIASDADNSDGVAPDLSALADWECYAGVADFDNPSVPNLTLVSGSTDLSMFPGGDNVILADGTDLTVPIDPATYLDSMNFAGGGGEAAMMNALYDDMGFTVTSAVNQSLMRCPDGSDSDYSSDADFVSGPPTPGSANIVGCTPQMFARNATVAEGDTGSTTVQIAVVRSRFTLLTSTVVCQTLPGGTASPGIDFVTFTNTLTFPPGVGTQFVNVVVFGDTQVEPDETILLSLSSPSNATVLTPQVTIRVLDNDLPTVSASDISLQEGNGGTTTAVFSITLSAAYSSPVSVQCVTSNGTASAGSDYAAVSTNIVFPAGTTLRLVNVTVFGDTNDEPNEVFTLHLMNPVNATLGHTPGTCTIVNDDGITVIPDMWISDAQVLEGNSGVTTAVFTVTLSTFASPSASVFYATANGTASAPVDYTAIPSTLLTFPPGITSRTISVNVLGDLIVEPDQTFFVNLSGASGANLVDASGIGTILDDDVLTVTCPNTITSVVGIADAGTNVFYSASVSANECGAGVIYAPPSGSFFPVGTSTVTATASDACDHSVTCAFSVVVNQATGTGAVRLAKTVYVGHDGGAAAPGAQTLVVTNNTPLTFCFVATNSGDLTLTNVTINDSTLAGFTPIVLGTLAPGQTRTGIFETALGASLTNRASVVGTPAGLAPVAASNTATVVVVHPAIQLQKTVYAGQNGGASAPGVKSVTVTNSAPITFCFVVTNSGDIALTNVVVTDATLPGFTPLTLGTLNPGQVRTGIFETALSASLTNRAAVTGAPPGLAAISAVDTATVTVFHPAIALSKSVYTGHDGGASAPGAKSLSVTSSTQITYCFVITNSGDIALTNVVVTDATLPGFTPLTLGTLNPGQVRTGIFETALSASLTNRASVTGMPPGLVAISAADTAMVKVVHPAIALSKSVYVGHDGGVSAPGQDTITVTSATPITFCFIATNSGDTVVTNVTVTDAMLPGLGLRILGALQPGQTATTIFETALGASLTNTGFLTGSTVVGSLLTATDTATVIVLHPKLVFSKTVYAGHNGGASAPGAESIVVSNNADVTFCFVATNGGDVALTNVVVNDATLPGFTPLTLGTLAPGQVVTSIFETTASGSRTNLATATGSPPSLSAISTSDTAVVMVLHPKLGLNKTVYVGHNGGASAPGAESVVVSNNADVTFCFVATNSGDAVLTNVVVNDATLPGFTPLALGTLTPGQVVTSIFETVAASSRTNLATVSGAPLVLPAVSTSDTAVVIVPHPKVGLNKTVYIGHNGGASAPGSESVVVSNNADVTFCFVVTNSGDIALTNVVVSDATLPGFSPLLLGTLSPGQVRTGIFETALSASLTNRAAVTGAPPALPAVSTNDTAAVIVLHPKLGLNKTVYAGHNGGASAPGSESVVVSNNADVTFCFVATNGGDVALTNVVVNDATLPGFTPLALGTLAPGQVVTSIFETTASGSRTNLATATGSPPVLPAVSTSDTAVVVAIAPRIALSKTAYAGHNGGASAPGVHALIVTNNANVTYCFVVTNTGDYALTNVVVTDATLPGFTTLALGTLTPGQAVTSIYQTTAGAASRTNSASVSGSPGSLPPVMAGDTAVVVVIHPKVGMNKTVYAGHNGGASAPGQESITVTNSTLITYCFVVTNSGDIALTNVVVTDASIPGFSPIALGTLTPGQAVTSIFETTAGASLTNRASVTGAPPMAPSVSTSDTAAVVVVNPQIAISKTVYRSHNGGASVPGLDYLFVTNGSDVTYCFVVTNRGNIALSNVTIGDASLTGFTNLLLGTLNPGQVRTGIFETTVSFSFTNLATVMGSPVPLPAITARDTAVVVVVNPLLDFSKSVYAGHDGGSTFPGTEYLENTNGAAITYVFFAINAGDTVLTNVTVTDPGLIMPPISFGTMAPGQSATGFYETAIAGSRINKAFVTGLASGGLVAGENDTAEVKVIGPPNACDYSYEIIDLGTFGGTNSQGLGLNDLGQVVGQADAADGKLRAFLWEHGEKVDLGTLPGGLYAFASSINELGEIVGTSDATGTVSATQVDVHAFRYANGVMTDLGTLGGKSSIGRGINIAGDVAGWSFRPFQNFNTNPYLHTGDTNINLGTFCTLDDAGDAFGINDATQIVGFATECGPFTGFRPYVYQDFDGNGIRSPYDLVDLGTFGGANGVAHAINNAGQIVGGADVVTSPHVIRHAFLITPIQTPTGLVWSALNMSNGTNALMTDLGLLPGSDFADAWDINDSGVIVGRSYSTSTGVDRAFIYQAGTMTQLDSLIDPGSGWTLTQARAINNLGQITGYGVVSNRTHGFLLNPCISEDGSLRITRLITEDLNPHDVIVVWKNVGLGRLYILEGSSSTASLVWSPLPPTNQWPTPSTYWPMTLNTNAGRQFMRVRLNP